MLSKFLLERNEAGIRGGICLVAVCAGDLSVALRYQVSAFYLDLSHQNLENHVMNGFKQWCKRKARCGCQPFVACPCLGLLLPLKVSSLLFLENKI